MRLEGGGTGGLRSQVQSLALGKTINLLTLSLWETFPLNDEYNKKSFDTIPFY